MECVDENDKKLAACLIHCGQMFSPAPGTPGNALVENYVSDVELYTHGAGRRDERIWFAYKYKKTNTEQVADWVNFLTLGPNVYCSFPGFPGTTAKPRIGFKVKRFANQ